MRFFLLALLLWSVPSPALQPAPPLSFERTMRVDYFHTGGPKSGETFALDRVVNDGRWPGSRTQLVDATGLGPYRFEVRDVASGAVLYSRGFASIYGEWETTSEVKTVHRTFHESVRFPWPAAPVRVAIQKRDAVNVFADLWTTEVDPASRFVNSGSAGAARERLERDRERSARAEGRPAGARRGLHAGGDGEVPRRRQAAGRRALRAGAVPRAVAAISTCGRWTFPRPRAASTARTPAYSAARRSRLNTTSSIPSATSSRSTTGRCATRHRPRRTSSSRSWSTNGPTVAVASSTTRRRPRSTARFPSTCSSTSSVITSRRWPTSTTRRTSPTTPARRRSWSRGSRTSPRCSIGSR